MRINSNIRKPHRKLASSTVLIPGDGTTNWVLKGAVNGFLGVVNPSSSVSAWDKGGSFGVIPAGADFVLSFNIGTISGGINDVAGMAGLSLLDASSSYIELEFAFQLNGQILRIYEQNGSVGVVYGNANLGDKFEIKRVSNVVKYFWNGVKIYDSLVSISSNLLFDSSINKNARYYDISVTIY